MVYSVIFTKGKALRKEGMHMKQLKDPMARILNMRIDDINKTSEDKKNERLEKLNIYQRYEKFEKMMNVYNRYQHTANYTNLLKNVNPAVVLDKLFRDEKINNEVSYEEFLSFIDVVEQTKEEKPDLDLSDITSRESRIEMSEIMSQTQQGKEIVPADLDFIAVIKGYGLYRGMVDIQKGEDRDKVLKQYDLTEEMLQNGENRKNHFDKQEMRGLYDHINKGKVDEAVYVVAGALEIGPGEAQTDLEGLGLLKGKEKEPVNEECLLVYKEEVSKLKVDLIIMDPTKTEEQKKQALDDYYNKVDGRNKVKAAEEKEYRNLHDGKPSPRFLRELNDYMKKESQSQEQSKIQQNGKIVVDEDREVG